MLELIRRCFQKDKVYYTRHARHEMLIEERGIIMDSEVGEAIHAGEVIENYPDDEPFPSVLIFGKTAGERPLHIVCAYDSEDELAIVVTAYEPDPLKWIDLRRRKQ